MSDENGLTSPSTLSNHKLYIGDGAQVMRLAVRKILAPVHAVELQARSENGDAAQIMTLREGRDFDASVLAVLFNSPPPLSSLKGLASRVFLHLYEAGYHPFLDRVSGFKNQTTRLLIRLFPEAACNAAKASDADSAVVKTAMGKAQLEAEEMIDRFYLVSETIAEMKARIRSQSSLGKQYAQLDEFIRPTPQFEAFGDDWLGDVLYSFKAQGFKVHLDTQEFNEPMKGRGWSTLITLTWGENPQIPERKLPKKPGSGRGSLV